MKLTDKEYFEINCGGAIEHVPTKYPDLEECLNLKILGIAHEEKGRETIELENGKKLFIEAKDEIATQCLGKILITVQRDYIGKQVKDLINREFCLAEKIG